MQSRRPPLSVPPALRSRRRMQVLVEASEQMTTKPNVVKMVNSVCRSEYGIDVGPVGSGGDLGCQFAK